MLKNGEKYGRTEIIKKLLKQKKYEKLRNTRAKFEQNSRESHVKFE